MQKFTIFSAILTIIIVVVVAEIVVSDYSPGFGEDLPGHAVLNLVLPDSLDTIVGGSAIIADNAAGLNNYLGSDLDYGNELISEDLLVDTVAVETIPGSYYSANVLYDFPESEPEAAGDSDFEDLNYTVSSPDIYIRDEQLKSAGFNTAYTKEEPHNGYFFKTIYIDDIPSTTLKKTVVRDDSRLFAKVYVFTFDLSGSSTEIYDLLKLRASKGLGIEINETNTSGDASFYMNDLSRQNVAFLTVRINDLIYGFSYPKEYHSQITNLVRLIELEF